MENTVTISVSEYDALRETKKEAHRLSLIKEPVVKIELTERPYRIGNSFSDRDDYPIKTYQLSMLVPAELEPVFNELREDFKNAIKKAWDSIMDEVDKNNELIKRGERLEKHIKSLSEHLDKIPNWVKRWYGAIYKK